MAVITYYMPRHHRTARAPRVLVNLIRGRVKQVATMAVAVTADTVAERNAIIDRRRDALFAHFGDCGECTKRGMCDAAVKYMDRTAEMQGVSVFV